MSSAPTELPATTIPNSQDTDIAHTLANSTTGTANSTHHGSLKAPSTRPTVSSGTGLSGVTANDPSHSISHRVSKRSLRRRGSGTSSKRSHNAASQIIEKSARPMSTTNTQTAQPRAKKKSKFLSFLCCGSPDENGEPGQELTEAPRQSAPQQASQPVQQASAAAKQSSSTPLGNNNDGNTASLIDEKTTSPAYPANGSGAMVEGENEKLPVIETPRRDESQYSAAALGGDDSSAALPTTAVIPPRTSSSRGNAAELSTGEAPRVDTSVGAAEGTSHLGNPAVVVQAPTPIIPQGEEDELISDRTPEQEARDKDIEMTDNGPSLPLSANDVSGTSEDETHTAISHNETHKQIDLPPPPPLEERQAQVAHEAAPASPYAASPPSPEPQKWLLPPVQPWLKGRKCLVLDLDETLVHSSFKVLHQADFTIPVEIEGQYHNVYVIKRPGVDQFMKRVGELYEVVVFTASVSKYGDPLLDQLDIHGVVHHRLFRESCYNHQGNYVKDLSQVGRDLKETIIIDNSPTSYIFHPQHAVPISSWFSDAHDNELLDLIPVLEDLAGPAVSDVSLVLDVAL
ncbi:hypothetical protein AAFC00_005850 [Neodothiora populina]|uniref:FCP1 homology domain-containing protein n=1 Tax=Neodothiora populina TaxID=2781224 RepID=A0ABR3P6B2_9PEZI